MELFVVEGSSKALKLKIDSLNNRLLLRFYVLNQFLQIRNPDGFYIGRHDDVAFAFYPENRL